LKLVCICSPFCGEIDRNIKRAQEYCEYAVQCGVTPLAPHTIFNRYLDDQRPLERQTGQNMALEVLTRCDELWVMGDNRSQDMQINISAAQKECIPTLYVPDMLVESGYKIRQANKPFSYEDCIPDSNKMDYENQILVLKPEAYGRLAEVTADESLWLAQTGFGCTYGARGQAVFATNLLSGRMVHWERHDFYGIVEPLCLYEWLSDKPVYNERADEIVRQAEREITDTIDLRNGENLEEDSEIGGG